MKFVDGTSIADDYRWTKLVVGHPFDTIKVS
jgi:hypothetical protein